MARWEAKKKTCVKTWVDEMAQPARKTLPQTPNLTPESSPLPSDHYMRAISRNGAFNFHTFKHLCTHTYTHTCPHTHKHTQAWWLGKWVYFQIHIGMWASPHTHTHKAVNVESKQTSEKARDTYTETERKIPVMHLVMIVLALAKWLQ